MVRSNATLAAPALAATTSAISDAACPSAAPAAVRCSAASAAADSTETMVPGTACPIDSTTNVSARRSALAKAGPSISVRPPSAVTSARPRRICDRITPEFPRAPRSAPSASRPARPTRSRSSRPSVPATAARMVNSMLVPVSESATGKTLRRLISSVWVIRCATAVWAQRRNADASTRAAAIYTSRTTHPTVPARIVIAADRAGDLHRLWTAFWRSVPEAGILVRLSGHPPGC